MGRLAVDVVLAVGVWLLTPPLVDGMREFGLFWLFLFEFRFEPKEAPNCLNRALIRSIRQREVNGKI